MQEVYGESDLGLVGIEGCLTQTRDSLQHKEPDAGFREFMDDFDTKYGISDFGYDEQGFQIFPCTSMDVCTLQTPSGNYSFIPKPDLNHPGSVRRAQLLDVIDTRSSLTKTALLSAMRFPQRIVSQRNATEEAAGRRSRYNA